MYKYRNVSGSDQSIVGLGLVPADKEFESAALINNPNFELTSGEQQAPPASPVSEPAETQNVEEIKENTEHGA